ncbi:MAG: hypothetical protein Q4P34_08445 [Tissierellia bacterium]|nr:hypothetical protein [Tissierellia bacterium]
MLKKELKLMIKNPAYFIIAILPFALSFFMSEGTKNYLLQYAVQADEIISSKEVIIYTGKVLDARAQFATSELSFMVMMSSILIGLSVFEERRLHIWDRLVGKERLLCLKFALHYIYDIILIMINLFLYKVAFGIEFPAKAYLLFSSIPIISLFLGMIIGLTVNSRAVLSNSILMIVMLLGYFGGALSLTSVLANTRFMNVLMYISPLTIVNKLIFSSIIGLEKSFALWFISLAVFAIISLFFLNRRIKDGAVI